MYTTQVLLYTKDTYLEFLNKNSKIFSTPQPIPPLHPSLHLTIPPGLPNSWHF